MHNQMKEVENHFDDGERVFEKRSKIHLNVPVYVSNTTRTAQAGRVHTTKNTQT